MAVMAGKAAQTSREMPAKISLVRPDIVGENYDVAIRAHSEPLPDSTLVQRTLTPAPWLLFAD
jgi:DNA-binding transcriptional LysR family regulator